ncbi:MAG TPA: ATP synthase F1 subunit gamma [Candidatus Krumholzibacteria bacterium]|nr:ATP synthase F1 subunit gamma [Candidatus Krumholzibacteria bacterium]HRX51852.1 ATP synthase F1 subunit gamma [Candidatus Krumholzibacteria bacterium]
MAGAGIKVINKRIKSVKSTQQITKAMKMVSAAKLRRSQDRLLAARPYATKLQHLLQRLAGTGAADHPLFEVRDVKRRLYVVVTSDKGLCGAYNMNVMRAAQKDMDASRDEGVAVEVLAVGRKGRDFFRKRGYEITASFDDFGGQASDEKARQVNDIVAHRFLTGEVDEVRLCYAEFVSTMTQRPNVSTALPITPPQAEEEQQDGPALDYIWEPSKEAIYAALLPQYLRNRLYLALSEAYASEHGARMTSMSAATTNAGEMIESLTLQRNRERQAAITQEISEIVGGAAAL